MLYFATDYKAKDAELHSSRLIDAQKSLHVASQCSDNTFTSFFSRYPCAQFVKCHTIVSKPRSCHQTNQSKSGGRFDLS